MTTGKSNSAEDAPTVLAPLGRVIGRTRLVVLLAVLAVLLVALSLFLIGTLMAISSVWHAWEAVLQGRMESTDLTVRFLEIVSVMLKAVVFYLIAVGLYSLFIAPLNVTVALGVETLNDLETKVISVVVVIMSVTFLEHFIQWNKPTETLQFAGSLSVVVASLVLFQMFSHRAKEDQQAHNPDTQARAKREMFHKDHEQQEIKPDEIKGTAPSTDDE